jgi:hypothetical protein
MASRLLKLIALLLLTSAALGQQNGPESKSFSVTFYFPTQRAWFNHSLGYQSDRPQVIFDRQEKLIRLGPRTFVTVTLPEGRHQFWVKGCGANTPLVLDSQAGETIFVRVLYRRYCNSPEKSLESVSCKTAAEEGAQMEPIKAKNIFVSLSQITDNGAYFPVKCTD